MSVITSKLLQPFPAGQPATGSKVDLSKRVNKVTIVGVGAVGMAAAYSIMMQGLCEHLTLVDVMANRLEGEKLDMQQCSQLLGNRCRVTASTDYAVSADSDMVVVTAGARQREGESRLSLVQRNVDIFKGIIPALAHHSPQCLLVIVSNPVDVMTSVAHKLSGLPRERVIGTGTLLDTARFRHFIAERLGGRLDSRSVHGYVLGEHGDSSVPVWSSVRVGSTSLHSLHPEIGAKGQDAEKWAEIHTDVVQSAYRVIALKGYTSWAIGAGVARLTRALLHDERAVLPLSVPVAGRHGLSARTDADVCLSVPVVVGRTGVSHYVADDLSTEEEQHIRNSAATIADIITGIKW